MNYIRKKQIFLKLLLLLFSCFVGTEPVEAQSNFRTKDIIKISEKLMRNGQKAFIYTVRSKHFITYYHTFVPPEYITSYHPKNLPINGYGYHEAINSSVLDFCKVEVEGVKKGKGVGSAIYSEIEVPKEVRRMRGGLWTGDNAQGFLEALEHFEKQFPGQRKQNIFKAVVSDKVPANKLWQKIKGPGSPFGFAVHHFEANMVDGVLEIGPIYGEPIGPHSKVTYTSGKPKSLALAKGSNFGSGLTRTISARALGIIGASAGITFDLWLTEIARRDYHHQLTYRTQTYLNGNFINDPFLRNRKNAHIEFHLLQTGTQ